MPTVTFEIPGSFNWSNEQVRRQTELEWTSQIHVMKASPLFKAELTVKKPKPKRKRRKPLRCKQYKPRLKCTACKVTMDPNGKFLTSQGGVFCRKCFNQHFFKCQVCQQYKSKVTTQSARNPRKCRRCAAVESHATLPTEPRRVRDVSWRRGPETKGQKFEIVKSARTFGIEIETATCRFVERLKGKTTFGAKYDATVTGREFDSPILCGDEGLQEVIDFCDHAKRRGWKVDRDCGLHLHIGMQDEDPNTVRRIAYAYMITYPTWITLIDPHRIDAQYTRIPRVNLTNLRHRSDFYRFCEEQNRYEFINIAAWPRHNTIEIRGLQGTLDKRLIANWIIAHTSFADFAANSTYDELDRLFLAPNTENQCWHNMKSKLGSAARYFGRTRVRNQRASTV